MIRLVCFLIPFFFVPSAYSTTLSKISTSQIGETVTTIKGSSSSLLDAVVETTIALNKSGAVKSVASGAALTIPLIAKRAIPALSTAYALGYLADCAFDLVKAYNNRWLDDYPLLKDILDTTFPSSTPYPQKDDIMSSSCGNIKLSSSVVTPSSGCSGGSWYSTPPVSPYISCSDKRIVYYFLQSRCSSTDPNSKFYKSYGVYFTVSTDDVTWPSSGRPEVLNDQQKQTLVQNIVDAFTSNPAVKTALDSLSVAHPEVVTTPTPITQQDINNWATTNNYNTNQTYIDYLTNLKNTYEGDTTWIDQEIAKAQAEQEKEQTEDAEDTFDPITSSAFDPAYNPGEFDIPARFTSFLQNVKSSGLFSFSSSFFDSLPGGGSPLLTIEGGQTFGTHTYDFSQAFSSGLPILKAVLLALFGFLSVRAVIMKR